MRRNEGFEIDSTVRFLSDVASVRLKMAYSLAIKIESYISSLVWFKWVFSIYSTVIRERNLFVLRGLRHFLFLVTSKSEDLISDLQWTHR